jgi:hypothetical protein
MRLCGAGFLCLIALSRSVCAQVPAPLLPDLPAESVTVTATRPSEAAVRDFIATRAAPAHVTGKLTRWRTGICPEVIGLAAKYVGFVQRRMRDVAASVGAPVNADPACKPNIEVVFTTEPQNLLNNIRQNGEVYLGYHDSATQAATLATVSHAIQAWYTTATADLRGRPQIDSGKGGGLTIDTLTLAIPGADGGAMQLPGGVQLNMPNATTREVTGNRLGNGLSSEFANVLIVAEPAKLLDYEIGTLADYVAMLALSQPASFDACQEMPSISNLLASGCRSTAHSITDGDIAYLRGLYTMTPAANLAVQRDEMRYRMLKDLEKR